MAYKQPSAGLPFKEMGSSTPVKQLKGEYMRTPEEKAFYESPESKDYEPVPHGTYRGIGSYSKYTGEDEKFDWDTNTKPRKKGDVVSKGIAGSKPKKKTATSEKVGPVESPEALAKKKAKAKETKVGPSGTDLDASDADYETDKKERAAHREAQKYVKKK